MGKTIRTGTRHLLYGLWAGWTGVLLLSRTELIRFTVKTPPDGILGYCFLNGYPKQQDYFWYCAMVLGGLAGVLVTRWLLGVTVKKGADGGWEKVFAGSGLSFAVLSLLLGLSMGMGKSPVTWAVYLAGIIFPWFTRGWYTSGKSGEADLPAGHKFPPMGAWAVTCLAVSLVWVADARLRCRPIDGIHEGTQLLYVQSVLDGQKVGVDFRSEYGPLATLGLYGWMKAAGMNIAQERVWSLLVQGLGVALGLLAFRLAGLGLFATTIGSLLVLAESSALGVRYGLAYAMRAGLAFLAVILYWRGREGGTRWMTVSGFVQSLSLMYSPDFGMASAAAISAMFLQDRIRRERQGSPADFGKWIGATLAGLAVLSLAVYGKSAFAGLSGLLFGGYGGGRLAGHGALPFPVFELLGNWEPLRQVWLIGLVSTGMLGWSILAGAPASRGVLITGAGIFTLLAMVPGLARPHGQFLFAVPSCMFMVAVGLDSWRCQGGRKAGHALLLGGFLVVLAVLHLSLVSDSLILKYTRCFSGGGMAAGAGLPERLGGVDPKAMAPEDLLAAVRTISSHSGKGDYIYVGTLQHQHLCFLADRSGLPPYPSGVVAATKAQRAVALESLRKYRPPVALIGGVGLDIPYVVEHKEEVEYIRRNYTLVLKTGDLLIYRIKQE